MLHVQLRRSRAENYFLPTSLGLFSSKQKHTLSARSKTQGRNRENERGRGNKMGVARMAQKYKERFFSCMSGAERLAKRNEKFIFLRFYCGSQA